MTGNLYRGQAGLPFSSTLRFPKKEGMRIDFVLASPALAARVTGAAIDREERKGKGASDHAPVLVELAD
jgi:exodeoxyribonuclease-3